MILQKPIHSVEDSTLFVRGERENDIALGHITLSLKANQCSDQNGIVDLHVLSAASIEVTILLNELERIGAPIAAQSLDNIQMANNQNRLERAGTTSPQTRNQVTLAFVWTQHADI